MVDRKEQILDIENRLNKTLQTVLRELSEMRVVEGLEQTRQDFLDIFEIIEAISLKIIKEYKRILKENNLDPGVVEIFMVGGRLKNKMLKLDSDIDLLICVENSEQSATSLAFDRFGDPMDAVDFRSMLQQEILSSVSNICEEFGIKRKFHILDFGRKIIQGDCDDVNKLLLARA